MSQSLPRDRLPLGFHLKEQFGPLKVRELPSMSEGVHCGAVLTASGGAEDEHRARAWSIRHAAEPPRCQKGGGVLGAALALWCSLAIVEAPDYDAFSGAEGFIAERQELAAWKMMRDPDQLEAVYSDAAKGKDRAARIFRQLEATLSTSGRELAERLNRPGCLVPVAQQLCAPDWSFLDFLSKERPGGVRLRIAVFSAFAARAHELGLRNQVILSAVNGLLSVAFAGAVLARANAAISETVIANATRLTDAELATGERLARKLGVPLAESPHRSAEYVDPAGRTYDALGKAVASRYWNEKEFFDSIRRHLLKSNDFTVIDLTGFTPGQISAVERYLSALAPGQLAKIIRIGF